MWVEDNRHGSYVYVGSDLEYIARRRRQLRDIPDVHHDDPWFPPNGYMTPTRKDRYVPDVFYMLESSKPLETAIRFDPSGAGRPLAMGVANLTAPTQILFDWMAETGILADFDNYIRGIDKITSKDIQEWWNDEDDMTPGPTKDETEILHGDTPRD